MRAVPQTIESFKAELAIFEQRFEHTPPETVVTLKDEEAGVEGYLVVWNTKISRSGPMPGSGKGGTRITPGVTLDEVKMLARTMALKNAAAGLPWGGAKAGLKADPDAPDFEAKYRRFAQLMKPYLHEFGGPYGGFGFDIGARPIHPVWICDELKSPRVFTGKPVHMGGTDYDKEGIAGLGVAVAARRTLQIQGKTLAGTTFAVQGIGAMGAAVIRYFSEYGGSLKAFSDPRVGGTYVFDQPVPQALLRALIDMDIDNVKKHLVETGVEATPSEDVLYADGDVLFPCAVHNVLREDNGRYVRAALVCEGANGPLTDGARTLLCQRGITVIPDFIANPGGIIAAFVELTSKVTPEENVKTRAKVNEAKEITIRRIAANVERVMNIVADLGVEPAEAGRYLALRNIFEGMED